MNRIHTAALAAVIASTSLGVASVAEAQSRHHGHDRRDEAHQRRDERHARRDDRRDYRQEQRAYARWQRAERRYDAGRYQAPRGYAVQQWSYGQRMPSAYRDNRYVVNDYDRYGLRAPPSGYQYVRSGNDVVLTANNGGLIAAVIASLFN